ncbi:ABC transporter permease subunit [Shinella sp. AETb1-6]|jgi:NitT/TauT family transport system permease protein|uniref:ABC transporter permease n=1 Tax=Shinella sumterensis TaxID=1967501 RepID=A0AA50DBD4_9HYPH|nr:MULTISPECIES: ABC transporter permease [Shinella]MDP9588112.1 NitT/TauT family transport system permease protein [Shinella zoogloeoides]MCD1262498.1 ABC transporter permease subunit [Shinella sumterensis]MXN50714.1 ABC transporter permease subunit [Shinella sp. AETb1-6]TFF00008.1 ABC transporter permease [Shinella sumterensis]WLS00218.1 ABC transporter permease [Shinella sumterensis]
MQAVNVRLIQITLLAVILGGWQLGVTTGVIDRFFFPAPLDIVQQVVTWVIDPGFYKHVGITLSETVLGYLIGTGLGVAAGVWLGLSPFTARILDPFIKAINAIPRVVLAPIFVLWLGLGLWSKVALAVTLVFFVTFFNAMQGVREVNPVVLSNTRILGARRSDLLRHVYFPAAASWILSSLRTSVGFAVVGAIIGEYLGASAGLGYLIARAEGNFDAVGVFAGIIILAVFVLIIDLLLDVAEKRLITWRPKAGEERPA